MITYNKPGMSRNLSGLKSQHINANLARNTLYSAKHIAYSAKHIADEAKKGVNVCLLNYFT